jgi:hypothetical protein
MVAPGAMKYNIFALLMVAGAIFVSVVWLARTGEQNAQLPEGG